MISRTTRALLLAMLASGLAPGLACDGPVASQGQPAATAAAGDPVIQVRAALIRRGSIVQRISAPGSMVARRESRLGPDVSGPIKRVFVEEGDRVEEGAPLFQVEPEPYGLAVRRAEAALDRVRAERRQLEADLARGQALKQKNVVSEEQTDRIATGVEVALAQQREAEEALAMARRDFERTLVRAPFAGSVVRRLVDEGTTALVQPQTIVILLQETRELDAIATIAEIHFDAIRVGDVALLQIEGLALPIASEVSAVGDALDPGTRTFRVKMRVDNAEHQLKAGLFVRVDIIPSAKGDVILAPRDAVRSVDGRPNVLKLREGRAVLTPIEIGLISEAAVEVLAGLRVDDQVVVGESARTLAPGMRVEVRGGAEARDS